MMTVTDIAREIVAREGGFVDDPDDPGGATQHGVTIHTMRRLGLDLTGDGRIDTADVRAMTVERAIGIFVGEYFARPKIGALPEALQPPVFDMYVNAGSRAVIILQQLLAATGRDLKADGTIGPQTIRAAQLARDELGDVALADAYGAARRDYYYRLADGRPASRKYARRKDGGKGGWIVRAEEFMSPAARLTEAEHRARTARWT